MTHNHKIFALDLKNATVENFDHWCLTQYFNLLNNKK